MLVTIGQRADAEVCRGRNASGGMRIGAEQLLADGEDAGLYNDLAETLTHAVGLQAGYAIPFSKTVSFTPAAAYFVNFDGTNDPVPMYWAGGSLNLDRFSIYAALENAVDSDADPKLRLGVSLNVGGARR